MARQVLPIVGAVIGGYFGGPQGAQWGYAIGSLIGNAVDPQIIKGPKLGEAGLQTSAEGVFRPIVFGKGAVKGNVISRGNRQVKKKRERQGKGGPVTETERVYWTFAIRICEAKDDTGGISLLRIWEDEKLVYDVTPDSQIVEESSEYAERFRFYNGSDDQLPDPDLEAFLGVGNVNAYRGTCYAVFPAYDLTDTGERIKDYRWEVASAATDTSVLVDSLAISSTSGNIYASPDGINWSLLAAVGGGGNDKIFSGPDRYVRWSLGIAYFSIDGGANWITSSGSLGNSGGARSACYLKSLNQYVIGANIAGVSVSADDCASFQTYPTRIGIVAASDSLLVAVDVSTARLKYASNAAGVWTTGPSVNTDLPTTECAAWGDPTFKFGGGKAGVPAVLQTGDGTGYTIDTLPAFATATKVISLCFGNGIWVAGTDSGERMFDLGQGAGWELADDSFGAAAMQISFNGDLFLMAGPGKVQSSPTGKTWTTRQASAGMRGVASLKYSNTQVAGDPVPLSAIADVLCARPGLAAGRYDTSELTDLVTGLVLADDYTYADAIRTLMPIYFFGATEHDAGSGYKLHFPKHGKAVVETLTIDDFVSVPDKTVRQDAYERPRVLHLHYQSPTVGYAPAKASPSRFSPDVKVVGEQSIQVPVSFADQDEAWQRADKILKIVWTGIAGEEEFSLPMNKLYLVPTDAVGISLRGQVRRMVFSTQSYAAGIIESKLVADRQGNYTSTLTGIPLPPPTPPPPSIVGPSIMAFGDWPALNDNNDRLLYYVGVTGQTAAWHGAQIDRSTDGGANFEEAATFTQNTIMGVLQDDVSAASRYFTDTTNVIRVHLYLDDEIESLTDAQFNSEGGAFMLSYQDAGVTRWEMLQYRDAEQDSNGDWLLTTLKRGQLNTDPVEHAPGDVFVLLDGVKTVDAITSWLNTDLTHRATSTGRSPDGVPTQTDEYTGASQREFPVASVTLSRDVDDITVSIIPRHRFGTESNPIRSINWERYSLEISDGSSVSVVGTTSDTFTFDASALSSPITVSVSQRNRLTGDGPFVSESIA